MPTTFSTALPAIATTTRPANASEMPSESIVGSSASTNQSETNAASSAGGGQHADRRARSASAAALVPRPVAARRSASRRSENGSESANSASRITDDDHRERRLVVAGRRVHECASDGIAIAVTESSISTTMVRARSEPSCWVPCLRPPTRNASPSTSSRLARIEPTKRGPHHVHQPGLEREDADEQLGEVAQRRLQHAGRARPEPVAELLDRRGPPARRAGRPRPPRRRRPPPSPAAVVGDRRRARPERRRATEDDQVGAVRTSPAGCGRWRTTGTLSAVGRRLVGPRVPGAP